MIWTAKNCDKILVDVFGNKIPHVKSFNDETFEVEVYIMDPDTRKVCLGAWTNKGTGIFRKAVVFKGVINGAKLVDKDFVKKD